MDHPQGAKLKKAPPTRPLPAGLDTILQADQIKDKLNVIFYSKDLTDHALIRAISYEKGVIEEAERLIKESKSFEISYFARCYGFPILEVRPKVEEFIMTPQETVQMMEEEMDKEEQAA